MIDNCISNKLRNMSIVSALFIVWAHVGISTDQTDSAYWLQLIQLVGGFAVPYFFVAAGFLFAQHDLDAPGALKREIHKRVRSLLVPMFAWCFLSGVLSFIIITAANLHAGRCISIGQQYAGWGWLSYFAIIPFVGTSAVGMWFVRALFIFVCCGGVLNFLLKKWGGGLGWLIVLFAIMWLVDFHLPKGTLLYDFFHWYFAVRGLFYFTLGMYLVKNPISIDCKWGVPLLLMGVVLSFLRLLYPPFAWGFIPSCFVTGIGLWLLMPSGLWPKWFVSSAFPLFLCHGLAIPIVCVLGLKGNSSFSIVLLRGVFVTLACLVFVQFLRKHFPSVATVLFGGR